MMSIELYLGFMVASAILVLVPGPSIAVIVANSASFGPRAGMITLAGNTSGVAVLLVALIAGFAPAMALLSEWFEWFRVAGALYLVWLGISRFRATPNIQTGPVTRQATFGYFRQGVLVGMSNPKLLLFFAVFFPQFMDPAGNVTIQLVVLAVTFVVLAAVLDSGYALATGRARSLLSGHRARLMNRLSGSVLIGGGIWLALVRR